MHTEELTIQVLVKFHDLYKKIYFFYSYNLLNGLRFSKWQYTHIQTWEIMLDNIMEDYKLQLTSLKGKQNEANSCSQRKTTFQILNIHECPRFESYFASFDHMGKPPTLWDRGLNVVVVFDHGKSKFYNF